MSVHDGHRQRKRSQFLESGLDAFQEHEVLELLLYYAIPRKDTNPIAHALLKKFGSLDAVFAAPVEELMRVEGVGENAAALIRLIQPLYRRIRISATEEETILNSVEKAGEFFVGRFAGERTESMYQACLDAKGKLLNVQRLSAGDVNFVHADIRSIVQNALLCRASAVILAHNHPSGVALPSDADNAVTLQVHRVLQSVGVTLFDHIIVADDDFVSLRQNGLLLE
ncbi:MAG: DNA repair protein RadC [Oscillospiraceae bacterium]|nr:DNA repair protein RadC [Oscillospiraceae bacterium]